MFTFHFQPHAPAALMVLIKMGVVTYLAKAGEPKSANELADSCGGSELLIGKCSVDTSVELSTLSDTSIQSE